MTIRIPATVILFLFIASSCKYDVSEDLSLSGSNISVIKVSDNTFTPSSVNVNVGDTVEWQWQSGFHTTTSTSVPGGAIPWDTLIDDTHLNFQYIITQAGTYNYQCSFHASMGMTGTITAQ